MYSGVLQLPSKHLANIYIGTQWEKEWSSKENKDKLQLKHDAGIGAAGVGKKARICTKQ